MLLRARVGASLEKKRLRDRQRELFRKFATAEVPEELLNTGLALGGTSVDASVMFSDIRRSTRIAEVLSPEETIELLNSYSTLMLGAVGGQGGIVGALQAPESGDPGLLGRETLRIGEALSPRPVPHPPRRQPAHGQGARGRLAGHAVIRAPLA